MVMGALERLDPPRVLGDLTLLATLGEGGMATVHLAGIGTGPLARMCAVKLLRPNLPDHDYRTRFLDEARLVVRLHHNNIVDVRAAGEIDGQLYIAMEAIEGRDLADVWDRCAEVGRAFPVPLAVYVCREVLRGLHYAHTFPGLGLVHRDVSPSNVLIDWAGAVRLADFGLATSSLKASLTLPGVVFGKVGYMSPEQARHEPLDGRADVYAVSVILWELLTGRPLRSPEGMSTDTVARFDAPAPSSRSRRVDNELDAIVSKGLYRDRDERWDNARAMMMALNQWLADHSPEMGQEKVAEFMRKLFGNAREVEAAMRSELLRELTNRRVASGTQILEQSGALDGAAASQSGAKSGGRPAAGDAPDAAAEAGGSQGSRGAAEGGEGEDGDDEEEEERQSRSLARAGHPSPGLDAAELIESGTVIADRYRILSRLGRGGMGYVYLGEHVTVGRSVAIKVLTHDWSRTKAVAQRFRAESRAASAAGHPNIVEVFDAGELSDGRLYLVMEFLTGRNLYEEVQANGPMPVPRACHVMRDVARAIRAAHEVGIIHRDLKPDNVMLVERGRDEGELVKVLDFGISASANRSERLTNVGQALGTPEYMAPEQAKGREVDERFDIYAMGIMFYELLTGDPPWHGTNVLEIIALKTTEEAPSVGKRREDNELPPLPEDLIELIDDCIALEPDRRPRTAQIFLARLEDVLRGLPRTQTGATSILFEASLTEGKIPQNVRGRLPINRLPQGAPVTQERRPLIYLIVGAIIVLLVAGLVISSIEDRGGDEVAEGGAAELGAEDSAEGSEAEGDPPGTTGGAIPASLETDSTGLGTDTGSDTGTETDTGTGTDTDTDTGEDVVPAHATFTCKRMREDAEKAAQAFQWNQVLTLTKKRACWRSRNDRAKLRVQALMELERWSQCVNEGRNLSDKKVKAWVTICEKRNR
ncbi:serine/threonine protein kinase [Pseudenhygromyxa sp. WMMC2535]|uniref:serine/threonine protein kinase n=1 Tax=Pseudenhygromyxa sp. WMMC2535 TaxID=2712867 RepID=UPI001553982C|nr:serine/threonine-protein kinase [Pseudenhygromyxa sp. WMMC2535]NVB40457.1 serine/threonine protein kinase [Pseudenhygromyxa sp. WMMC2535]